MVDLLKSYGGTGPIGQNGRNGPNEAVAITCMKAQPVKSDATSSGRRRFCAILILVLLLLATGLITFLILWFTKDNPNSTSALSASQSAATDDEGMSSSDATVSDATPPPFLVVGVKPIPATNLTTEPSFPSVHNNSRPDVSTPFNATSEEKPYIPDSLAEFLTELIEADQESLPSSQPSATSPGSPPPVPSVLPTRAPVTSPPTSSPEAAWEFLPVETDAPTFTVTLKATTTTPTETPSVNPTTATPTTLPTSRPTKLPTRGPTKSPTPVPTMQPTTPSPTAPLGPTSFPTFASIHGTELLQEDKLLFEFLVANSLDNGATLHNTMSPQYRAFRWLSGNMELAAYSDERKIQRYALATLFYSTGGDQWSNNEYWMSDEDECTMWFSRILEVVTNAVCNSNKQMITLDLVSQHFYRLFLFETFWSIGSNTAFV